MTWQEVLERAENVLPRLVPAERDDAERLLALCRALDLGALGSAAPSSDVVATETTRELGRLVEVLARRSARAMPLAALGRAALAYARGARRDGDLLVRETSEKLALFGF